MNSHPCRAAVIKAAAKTLFVFLLACACLPTFAQGGNDPRRDSQLWPDTQVTIKLEHQLSLVLFGTIRLGRDDSALVSQQAGIGLSRSLGKYFSSGLFYRYISNEPTPTVSSAEHHVFADLTARTPVKHGFALSDRNRMEWRDVDHHVYWRYRNRLQIERAFNIYEHKITPYVSGEAYYNTRYQAWNRSQLYVGARLPLSKHVTFDGFYMKQWDARVKPGFLNVIGTFLRLDF